ncbi:4-coumarate--CoA ligase-like 5 [Allomyces arbusculus]|nr:4-coumarate--CoA ligase-like 5 [Allomyces arbusculus]
MTPHSLVELIKDPRTKQADLPSLQQTLSIAMTLSKTTQQAMDLFKSPAGLTPGVEALLLDPTTLQPIPINTGGVTGPGELVVRGASIMSETTGYYNRPKETKSAFISIDGRPWYRMGDLIVMDADGCMTVMGRVRDTQVFPAEIEADILNVDGVLDYAVVPVRRDGNAEVEDQLPCAAVAPRSKAVFTDPAAQQALTKLIVDAIVLAMEPHNHLTGGVVFVDAVPRNQMGKLVRRTARNMVLDLLKLKGVV